MNMKINIKVIPHRRQAYNTVGNYWTDKKGVIQVRISKMDKQSERLVLVHELIELFMTDWLGITEDEITEFDLSFEKKRKKGNNDEPGFDSFAPYRREHTIATAVEMIMCAHMNIDWVNHEQTVNNVK